ncbi:probable multidrug resistance-associated protein lethal(2)03659 [Episyrphus balteatus]|uniref:probable multidrug resistance-associated protein lethal(2)03659 n=1 Tax=Episyrphus balteatus TaxID=286459 RepID=UPI002484EA52|nr:probable multidrug resistance-associated protein lethal(2)03659 [Episyrphus balteatus]XP_055853124.1 probable multidrug resistance-associated protein lethal(2)03659 [Episyrphus balteatus]XP_055853125.1 probable multidrug resistance-associated protein lethal(2)03659 [Episyrphus balteatus]
MQSMKADALPQNPRERANPLSFLCFCYTLPTFWKGRKKVLDSSDLYSALKTHKSDTLGNKLCAAWDNQLLRKSKTGKEPSLLRATLAVFGLQFSLFGLVLFFIEVGLRITQPLFLGGLVTYYSVSESPDTIMTAYLYALGIIVCSALNVMFQHPYMLGTMHVGMKMRVAMCSMIYRKALRLSQNALGDTTAGQVVNLISNDVGRLDLATIFVHYLWLGPLQTIVITYLMYQQIGISSTFGVAFMLLFLPLQAYLGKKTSVLRLRTALRTDERVRLMNEIIQGIQVIKMYAWEIPFGKMVALARKKEITPIRNVSYIRGILLSFIMFLTRVSIFTSLVGYVLLGYVLTAKQAFMVTAYYNILRTTMTVFFPQGISQLAEALVSIKRIQKYMLYDETNVRDKSLDNNELDDDVTTSNQSTIVKGHDTINGNGKHQEKQPMVVANGNATLSEAGVIISNLKSKWNSASTEYTLDDVNLRVQPGTLVAIIGPVGSGKSSLIQTILGELTPESGTVTVNGTYSYASQEPWLFTGTVRQNILFGQPMDKHRYRVVIKKCALERDLELLPHGDKTIVGERGASLSGGQKARISLARAVYRKTSIYLLDDPLSAVDTHVGRHLFDQCMRGYLRENIVVLVTHQLQFLQHADQIVIMDKGKVSAVGSYESLRESGLDFAKLLSDPESNENEDGTLSRSGSRLYKRQNSESSLKSAADSCVGEDAPMEVQEVGGQGRIGLDLYKQYFRAAGGFLLFFVILMLFLVAQILASGGDYFLSYWVNKRGTPNTPEVPENIKSSNNDTFIVTTPPNMIVQGISKFLEEVGMDKINDAVDIYIFTGITVLTIVITLCRSFFFFSCAMRASIYLHNAMFQGVTRATMYFFNTNPSGRILNRFSKDMGQVDEILPSVMIDVVQIFLQLIGIVVLVSLVNPVFLLPTAILGVIFYYLRVFYLKTSRDIKRMEAMTRSPVYSHLSASLSGLATIRSFGAQRILITEFDNHQDLHSSAFYLFISTNRAFGFWLDCFCVAYIAIITLSFFIFPPENGGNVGLAITQAIGMTGMVQWGMRQSAELENTMTAVERVVEYDTIEPEGALESAPEKKPRKEWPEDGKVVFDNLSLRYFPDPKSDSVLKNLNLEIAPCAKVGIVGRTGAGKSSLINALFRLSFNDGSVIIDQIDTNEIGLHDLRSKISIIPQEPVLFSGTMRYNLDPFDEYSDEKLWDSLDEVKLKKVVSDLPFGLQSKISEGGSNFSVGQRQLVCLARAILRENKILVMDEATANVDPQTDGLIQTTIRRKFKNCTVLTIAHRLHTVMDSDKVLVMDAGRAVEFGSPYELLTESTSKVFYGMVNQMGKGTFENFLRISKQAHEENLKQKAE